MRFGSFLGQPVPWAITASSQQPSLHATALSWLKDDRDYRRKLEQQGRKERGARRDQVCSL